jgi:putative transcriptional regulator
MADDSSAIHCRLDELLVERGMTLTELSKRVGVSLVNLSVLKNDRAKAIRFSTLIALCEALECQVGDLFLYERSAEYRTMPVNPARPPGPR